MAVQWLFSVTRGCGDVGSMGGVQPPRVRPALTFTLAVAGARGGHRGLALEVG